MNELPNTAVTNALRELLVYWIMRGPDDTPAGTDRHPALRGPRRVHLRGRQGPPGGVPGGDRERPRAAQQERPGRQASKRPLRDPPVRSTGDVSGDGGPRLCRRGGVRRTGAPDCLPERPKRTWSAQPSGPDDLRRVHATGQVLNCQSQTTSPRIREGGDDSPGSRSGQELMALVAGAGAV